MKDRLIEEQRDYQKLMQNDSQSPESVDAMIEYAWQIALTDPNPAHELSATAYKLSKKSNYVLGKARSKRNLAYCLLLAGRTKDCHKALLDCFKLFKETKTNNDFDLATVYDIRSNMHMILGIYDKALKDAIDTFELCNKVGYDRGKAYALITIGSVYDEMGDAVASLKNMRKALAIFQKISYPAGESFVRIRLATHLLKNSQSDESLQELKKGLRLAQENSIQAASITALVHMGTWHFKKNDLDKAEHFFRQSIAFDNHNNPVLAEGYLNIGRIYLKKENLDLAKIAFLQAEHINKGSRKKPVEIEIHAALSELYEKIGDSKKALKYFKKFHKMHKSVYNENTNIRIKNLAIQHEIEKKDQVAKFKENRLKEMIQLQNQAARSEKMAVAGNILAGLLHETNTPVGVINNNAIVSSRAAAKIKNIIEKKSESIARRSRYANCHARARFE